MFGLGAGEIFLIVLFALIFIGPKKIPELARGMGKALREFQKAKDDLMTEVHDVPEDKTSEQQLETTSSAPQSQEVSPESAETDTAEEAAPKEEASNPAKTST